MNVILKSSEIASHLNLNLYGDDIIINSFSQLSDIRPNTVVFAKKKNDLFIELLNSHKDIMAIVNQEYKDKLKCSYVVSNNPRMDYIKVLTDYFTPINKNNGTIDPTAIVDEKAVIGKDVTIGANCIISSEVIIGDNTIIHPNVVLDNFVSIGKNCEIKSGAIIGQSGFGFERDENGCPIKFPHFGGVVIGNNIYIGANTTIDRGTIGNTIIEDNVKIDNLVHIAHNCHIGKNVIVTAGAVFSGGTIIGERTWIAPNSTTIQKVKIGENSFVGIGSVVLRHVKNNTTVFGNPACNIDET